MLFGAYDLFKEKLWGNPHVYSSTYRNTIASIILYYCTPNRHPGNLPETRFRDIIESAVSAVLCLDVVTILDMTHVDVAKEAGSKVALVIRLVDREDFLVEEYSKIFVGRLINNDAARLVELARIYDFIDTTFTSDKAIFGDLERTTEIISEMLIRFHGLKLQYTDKLINEILKLMQASYTMFGKELPAHLSGLIK